MKKLCLILVMTILVGALVAVGCAQAPAPAPQPAPAPAPAPAPSTPKPSASPAPAASAVIELKYGGHGTPNAFTQKYGHDPWGKMVEDATKGKVKVVQYPGATLFKAEDAYDAVKSGIADIAWAFAGLQVARFPLMNLMGLPYLDIKSAEQASLCDWNLYQKIPALKKEWADTKVLTFHSYAPAMIGTKIPIRKLDDLKGLKLRSPGGGPMDALKAVGAAPMVVDPNEMYSSMEKGVIDGWTIDSSGAQSRKLQEVTKYYLPYPYIGVFFTVMNQQKFDSLPADVQQGIMSVSGDVAARFLGKNRDDSYKYDLEQMKIKPEQWTQLSQEDQDKWRKLSEAIWDTQVKGLEAKGLPAKDALNEINRFLKEYK